MDLQYGRSVCVFWTGRETGRELPARGWAGELRRVADSLRGQIVPVTLKGLFLCGLWKVVTEWRLGSSAGVVGGSKKNERVGT